LITDQFSLRNNTLKLEQILLHQQ